MKNSGRVRLARRVFRAALIVLGAWAALGPRTARAQACFQENECTFEKPNVLVVMDYSSSMVQENFGGATRWEAQLDAVRGLADTSQFTNDMHIALARFGHDPEAARNTTLPGDTSVPRLRDGFAVDLPFTDADGAYVDCDAAGLKRALNALPPPPNGQNLVGTWTRGALDSALALVQATRRAHPEDVNRVYDVVLMTDGDWNCRDSFDQEDCNGGAGETNENPAPAAAALLAAGVRVHVVAFGDGTTAADLDELARRGGTTAALDAASPSELRSALNGVLREVRDSVVVPECIGGLPRVMIIMDASTSMLIGSSAPGQSNWDKARFALAGNPFAPNPGDPGYVKPLFDRTVQVSGHTVAIEDVVHIGLIGYNLVDVQQLMLQYAPCARDNIAWAMDPYTSCVAPGCYDPYTDPDTQLDFTSLVSDGARNPPFVQTTTSFMPPCNPDGPGGRCTGLVYTTFTGEGLNAARVNLARYAVDSGAFSLDPDAPFVNVLVSDGRTSPDDPLDAVPVLADMLSSGVPTWVIGFGAPEDLDEPQLDSYAVAGGTGQAFIVDPSQGDGANALADRIAQVISGLTIDPCCQLNDCSETPEPPLPLCGNGKLDAGEACDEGARNGRLGGACAASCARTTFCGDGVTTGAEACDDANRNEADECTATCTPPGAGNGGAGSGGGGRPGSGASSGSGANGSGNAGDTGVGGNGSGVGGNGVGGNGSGVGGNGNGSGASGSGARSGTGASVNGSGSDGDGGPGSNGGLLDGGAGDAGEGASNRARSGDDSGCACRTAERSASETSGAALGAALGTLIVAFRRRRGRALGQ